MKTAQEIRQLKNYLVNEFYANTRKEQRTDREYYDDTFKVPWIRNPIKIRRTGRGARLVDSPAEHIITQNPVAYRDASDLKTKHDANIKVGMELNRWWSILKRQNPNPPKEFVKNLLLSGEAWIETIHNQNWVTGGKVKTGLPCQFILPDPLIVFGSPNEDENGVPEYVILNYARLPWIIKQRYPDWVQGDKEGVVNWLEYWDKNQHYAEANEVILVDTDNIYGFVPFVHKLAGFGKESPDGKMEDKIVGRLRKVRHTIERETSLISDIDSSIHLFANRGIDFKQTEQNAEVDPDKLIEDYEMGPGLAHFIPYGVEAERAVEMLPEDQIIRYLAVVKAELEREDPLVLAGSPVGESGRLQDMTMVSAMRRYDTIVENTEYAFATAFGMGLDMCQNVPGLLPEGIKKTDIDGDYRVRVELKAADPIEADRKATLGSRLYQQGEIDLRTNLTEYQGKTPEEADKIITWIMIDRVTMQSPEVMQIMGAKLAEKVGLADEIAALKQQQQMQQQLGMGVPPSEMTQRRGEVRPQGRELIDMALASRGQRTSPDRYFRQGAA